MPWLRVDDGFANHPKILALGNDQARWTWMRILLYAARYSTPQLPLNIRNSIPQATATFLQTAAEIGLLNTQPDGTYTIHDWAYYNPSDPTNAARQARYRHRQRNPVTDIVTPPTVTPPVTPVTQTTVTETVTPVTPPAAAGARVPSPNPDNEDKSSSSNRNADDDDLEQQLTAIGVSLNQRQRALAENPERVRACLAAARRNGRNPAAYFDRLLTSGEWPLESVTDERAAPVTIDVNDAVERFLRGVGWDGSYDQEAMREEFRRIESATRTTGRLELDRMMARWRELRAERFPEDAEVGAVTVS